MWQGKAGEGKPYISVTLILSGNSLSLICVVIAFLDNCCNHLLRQGSHRINILSLSPLPLAKDGRVVLLQGEREGFQ